MRGRKLAFLATALAATVSAVIFAVDAVPDVAYALPFLHSEEGVALHTQCGSTDDTQEVEFYDGKLPITKEYVSNHERPAVQLEWISEEKMRAMVPGLSYGTVAGRKWCSGTLISDTQVLTAGHCLDIQRGAKGSYTPGKPGGAYLSPRELAPLMIVNRGYQRDSMTKLDQKPIVHVVRALKEHREKPSQLDYAILEIEPVGSDGMKIPVTDIAALAPRAPRKDEMIAMFQHPLGWPKRVGAGTIKSVSTLLISYGDLDTRDASSGSAILDSEGAVVGIHTDGGCEERGGVNKGVRLDQIAKASGAI